MNPQPKTSFIHSLKSIRSADLLMTMAAIFLLVISIVSVLYIINGTNQNGVNDRTITVSATGESYQTPDIAEFTYSVREEGKEVASIQKKATDRHNAIIAKLIDAGIEKKDIQTLSISANPKYEWQNKTVACPLNQYCPPEGKNVLVGYETTFSVAVRVRDLEKSGTVLQLLGESNVDNLVGPNFTNEDPDAATALARNKALAKARIKAGEMTKAMGVKLGKVVSFSDNQGAYPMYSARAEMAPSLMAMDGAMAKSAPTAVITPGENKVSVTVNVIYKIK